MVGGDNSSGVALSTAELYNPTTGTFSYTAGNLNTARAGQSATLLGNGNVLVGGALLVYNNGNIVSSLELFDAATGTFSYTGSSGVVYGLPALLGNGNVLFLGFGTFSSELYNTATGTVSTAESYSSSPTSVYTQTSLYDGTTLVAGGEVAASGRFGGYGSTNVAGIYNTASGTTSSTGSLNYSRALHTATLLGNGQVLIAGGSGGACGRGGCSFSLVGPGELYSAPGIMGYFNPKYVVVGVTYAPPGSSSTVTYGGSTTVGNTTSTQSSFQSGLKVNVSVTKDISAWLIIGGVAVKIANSESSDSTQTSNSSTTVTTSKTSGVTFQTSGTPNCAPVNHDYDTIWLWLNPLTIYSVNPSTGAVQWNGYGYDNHDPSGNGGRDIFPVQVGYLNGDFQDDPSVDTVLARGWVTQYENLTWPAGQGPGLTSADKANILAADPFTNPSYSLPEPLPLTSPDLRFTEDPFNPGGPNPVAYSGDAGLTTNYNTATVNTESDSNGQTQSFQQQFGTDVQFSGGTWLAKMTVDIQTTDTLQWTYSWLDTLTTSQTYTDTLSVKEPTGCVNYTGPAQFLVYQDNHYGTYMFYPGN